MTATAAFFPMPRIGRVLRPQHPAMREALVRGLWIAAMTGHAVTMSGRSRFQAAMTAGTTRVPGHLQPTTGQQKQQRQQRQSSDQATAVHRVPTISQSNPSNLTTKRMNRKKSHWKDALKTHPTSGNRFPNGTIQEATALCQLGADPNRLGRVAPDDGSALLGPEGEMPALDVDIEIGNPLISSHLVISSQLQGVIVVAAGAG